MNITGKSQIRKITDNEMDELLEIMDGYFDYQEQPKVGIFWYSPRYNELFGIVSIDIDAQLALEPNRNKVSCKQLHKHVWRDNYRKYHYHYKTGYIKEKHLYDGDYKNTPRGRVFYIKDIDEYRIMVGSWIDEYPEAIDLIKYEFKLDNPDLTVKVEHGIHWEIGMGYGD